MATWVNKMITMGNGFIWSKLLYILIGVAIYFTVKTKFVQLRLLKNMFSLMKEEAEEGEDGVKKMSSFQAFAIGTATRVGTGNLTGVAMAISVGGPGAIFWMWIMAIFASSSAFIESTLAQIFKIKDKQDGYRGGPAYYMEQGLKGKKGKVLGMIFAICMLVTFGLAFSGILSNSITDAMERSFSLTKPMTTGILILITGIVIFGSVRKIGELCEKLVPIMAIGYLLMVGFVVFKNIAVFPETLKLIFQNAFGFRQLIGGGMGAALMNGIKRGIMSNEAGMGSAPNAAATASVSHPVKQGLVQTLSVFVDTLIICSATGFLIVMAGDFYADSNFQGIQLVQVALESQVGNWGGIFVALAIFLFSFSSLIGCYVYSKANIEFITKGEKGINLLRIVMLGMIGFGGVASSAIIWGLADLSMGLLVLSNLVAIVPLSKYAVAALNDYEDQLKKGKNPVFFKSKIKGIENVECWEDKNYENDIVNQKSEEVII